MSTNKQCDKVKRDNDDRPHTYSKSDRPATGMSSVDAIPNPESMRTSELQTDPKSVEPAIEDAGNSAVSEDFGRSNIAVQNVKLEKDGYRQLSVRWQPPHDPPISYSVQLFEKSTRNSEWVNIAKDNPTECLSKFKSVKCNHLYYCQVLPVYGTDVGVKTAKSQCVYTEKRREQAIEKKKNFGKAGRITANVREDTDCNTEMNIFWFPACPGENYQVIKYSVKVFLVGWDLHITTIKNREIFSENVSNEESEVKVHNILPGNKYIIVVTTWLRDFDSLEDTKYDNSISQTTVLGEVKLSDSFECANNDVTFHWNSVRGAAYYEFTVWDENRKELWHNQKIEASTQKEKKIFATVSMSNKIRSGIYCNVKVTSLAGNDLKSYSEIKLFFLGDKNQPKNVTAVLHQSDKVRRASISFGEPSQGIPDEYKIIAVASDGYRKTYTTQATPYICDRLQSNTEYTFEVLAKWGKTWSKTSKSNPICTEPNPHAIVNMPPVISSSGKTASYNISHAHIQQTNNVSAGSPYQHMPDLGKVNFRTDNKPDGENDIVIVTWAPPSFGKNHSNYYVEHYEIHVEQMNSKIPSIQVPSRGGEIDFSKKIKLNLGRKFNIWLETFFWNIDDKKEERKESEIRTVCTRPTTPEITINDPRPDKLVLKWNDSLGAKSYRVEIFVNESKKADIGEKVERPYYERIYDTILGNGKFYIAKVIAYSGDGDGVTNSSKTNKKLIGGDHVPTNVTAKIKDGSDTASQILVSWTQPKSPPLSFAIKAQSEDGQVIEQDNVKTNPFLFGDLRGGTDYYFTVIAIHNDMKQFGCLSNKETTSKLPMQVKGVWVRPGNDPTTSIEINWTKVEPRTEEKIIYEVQLKSTLYTLKKTGIRNNWQCMTGLPPGTHFSVTVAAYSEGWGIPSEICPFDTEPEMPRNVKLEYCTTEESVPVQSLQLSFDPTVVPCKEYICRLYWRDNERKNYLHEYKSQECHHVFSDLQLNCEYRGEVIAVYEKGESAIVTSNMLRTVPTKPIILKCESYSKEHCGSRQIIVQWDSDMNSHEVRFRHESSKIIEQIVKVKARNETIYNCQRESIQYRVEVRSRNDSGRCGNWSEPKTVVLAPAKLENILAKLEDDGKIAVTCNRAQQQSLLYFMNVICNNELVPGDPIRSDDGAALKWTYAPEQSAKIYRFDVWAEYQTETTKLRGEIATSNTVISKPADMEKPKVGLLPEPDNPGTDIKISWQPLENCKYQIRICNKKDHVEHILHSEELQCNYRCQRAGLTYEVAVRGVRDSAFGEWSEDESITLVPSEVKFEECEESTGPVEFIDLKWRKLEVPLKKYIVKMWCDDKKVEEYQWGPQTASRNFVKPFIHPGQFYRFEIAALNDAGMGRFSSSRTYHIIWDTPKYLKVNLDDIDPCHKAIIEWDKSQGITHFELHIKNLDDGGSNIVNVSGDKYTFKSGTPGSTYEIELYWGYNTIRGSNCLSDTLTMKPSPPQNITVMAHCDGVLVTLDDAPSIRKIYKISLESLQIQGQAKSVTSRHRQIYVPHLTPGASYTVSVKTIINEAESFPEYCNGIVQILPARINNLKATCMGDHVFFTWDDHQFSPRYFVQWRVENGSIVDGETSENSFTIFPVKPCCAYFLRVAARNASGDGEMTGWMTFYSKPDPPRGATVSKDPKRSTTHLVINIDDEIQRGKTYQIRLKPFNRPDDLVETVKTSDLKAVVNNLRPGTGYNVYVKSLYHNRESKEVEGHPSA